MQGQKKQTYKNDQTNKLFKLCAVWGKKSSFSSFPSEIGCQVSASLFLKAVEHCSAIFESLVERGSLPFTPCFRNDDDDNDDGS